MYNKNPGNAATNPDTIFGGLEWKEDARLYITNVKSSNDFNPFYCAQGELKKELVNVQGNDEWTASCDARPSQSMAQFSRKKVEITLTNEPDPKQREVGLITVTKGDNPIKGVIETNKVNGTRKTYIVFKEGGAKWFTMELIVVPHPPTSRLAESLEEEKDGNLQISNLVYKDKQLIIKPVKLEKKILFFAHELDDENGLKELGDRPTLLLYKSLMNNEELTIL